MIGARLLAEISITDMKKSKPIIVKLNILRPTQNLKLKCYFQQSVDNKHKLAYSTLLIFWLLLKIDK